MVVDKMDDVKVRNPLAGPNRRVNVPKVEPDKTKYKRKPKHKHKEEK